MNLPYLLRELFLMSSQSVTARSLAAQFFRAETGIFLALWLFLMVLGQWRLFRDPGTFWHTRVGQIIRGE